MWQSDDACCFVTWRHVTHLKAVQEESLPVGSQLATMWCVRHLINSVAFLSCVILKTPRLFDFPLTRLSSLTIGDSERKSSATQQREPTPDIPVESTGNCTLWHGFFVLPKPSAGPISQCASCRSWSGPEMCGGTEGPARFWLHSMWGTSQAGAECSARWGAGTLMEPWTSVQLQDAPLSWPGGSGLN